MSKIYFEVEDSIVIKHIHMSEIGEANVYKDDIVITKEIFQECYEKWIKQESQEPKTGHWIIMHDGEYYCDRCNCESPNNEKWNYCPICGAEMVKPRDD